MAISYPLSMPTNFGMSKIELRAVNAVAYSQSPFTFAGQVHAYAGQTWQADITLPNMKRDYAEEWVAFLVAMRGQYGTFLLADPLGKVARGTPTGTPVVKGASQLGGTFTLDGATPSVTGWLKAGDYIQLGSSSGSRLHKVLLSADSDGSGNVTLELWPHIRTAPTDNTAVIVSNASGLFRLASNEQAWSINEISSYGIAFGAMEVI
jgi:hypothetical protein